MSVRKVVVLAAAAVTAFAMPATAFAAGKNPELISVTNDGKQMADRAGDVQMSDDGRKVAFAEIADENEAYRYKIYVRDRDAKTTKRYLNVSVDGDSECGEAFALSGNSRYLVVYHEGGTSPFIKYDLDNGTKKTFHGPDKCYSGMDISDDGSKVVGFSYNTIDAINTADGKSRHVAGSDEDQIGDDVKLSGDGSTVAYTAGFSSTVDDTIKAYKASTSGGTPKRVDIGKNGAPTNNASADRVFGLSADGRLVLFGENSGSGISDECSAASDQEMCLYRRDTVGKKTDVVNRDRSGRVWLDWNYADISDDGTKVAYTADIDHELFASVQVLTVSTGKIKTLGHNADGEVGEGDIWDFDLAGKSTQAAVNTDAINYGVTDPDGTVDHRRVFAVDH